jgi:hypothetical protein
MVDADADSLAERSSSPYVAYSGKKLVCAELGGEAFFASRAVRRINNSHRLFLPKYYARKRQANDLTKKANCSL